MVGERRFPKTSTRTPMDRERKFLRKEPSPRSFLRGKLQRPASSPRAAFSSASASFPGTPWPPSLIPNSGTTAWTGVCFSRLVTSGTVPSFLHEPFRFVTASGVCLLGVFPLDARARAPPLCVWCLQQNGGNVAEHFYIATGAERAKHIHRAQAIRGTRDSISCSRAAQIATDHNRALPFSHDLTPLRPSAGASSVVFTQSGGHYGCCSY